MIDGIGAARDPHCPDLPGKLMTANVFRAVDRSVEYVLFLMFLAFTLVGGLQVFNRFVLGLPLSWPVVIAPMGGLILFHPEGDREMARGAALGDTLQFLSGAAGWSVEDVAKAAAGPKMFQLYHHGDRAWAADLIPDLANLSPQTQPEAQS